MVKGKAAASPRDSLKKVKPSSLSSEKSRLKKSIFYEVGIKNDSCKGCGLCVVSCPAKHLKLSSGLNKRGVSCAEIVHSLPCLGCGFCFLVCPDSCIEVYEEKAEDRRSKTE